MRILLLLLLVSVLCGSSRELQPNRNRSRSHKVSIVFIGTVKSIEPLGKRDLRVIPVDVDPRFAITVHVESVTPKETPLKVDTDQVFAVHSPARLFSAVEEEIIGRKYRFKVAWNEGRNESTFSDLTAFPIADGR